MANQVAKRILVQWLLRNGFEEQARRASGNRKFSRAATAEYLAGSITVPGYGPNDLTKKHVGMILRQLEQMGFDKGQVLSDITGKKKT